MKIYNLQDTKYDINDNNRDYYEKMFPINNNFIFKSKHGTISTLVSKGILSTNNIKNGKLYLKFYVIVILKDSNYRINYPVEECISLVRTEKIKRLLDEKD